MKTPIFYNLFYDFRLGTNICKMLHDKEMLAVNKVICNFSYYAASL